MLKGASSEFGGGAIALFTRQLVLKGASSEFGGGAIALLAR
ncbi:hypothetical protein [Nostoc sp. WHI]|nr:hypothetical protein [Nostoc sp. WHI]